MIFTSLSAAIKERKAKLFYLLLTLCFAYYPLSAVAKTTTADATIKLISHHEIDPGFQPEEGTYSYDIFWGGSRIGDAYVTLVKADDLYAIAVEIKTNKTKEIDIVPRSKAKEVIHGEKDDIPLLDQDSEDIIDKTHEKASDTLISAAVWLDSFFGNRRYLAEENRSRAKLKLMGGIEDQGEFQFRPRLSVRLHLPAIEERLSLLVSANSDEDFDVDRDINTLNSREEDTNLQGALQFFARQTEKMNIATSVGLSTSYAYAGARYRGLYDYNSWQGRLISRLRYYTDNGFEFRNQYDIEKQVAEKFLFRTTLEANWEEERNGVPHAVILSLFHVLRSDRAFVYDISNYMHTSPDYQLVDTVFRVRYRQRFYRDWLVVEIAPQLAFPEVYNRDITPGIIIKLEADFGYTSYERQFNNIFSF